MVTRNTTDKVILHCSATPDDSNVFDTIGADEIRQWHVEENGWADIGYHFVIKRNGDIESGRPLYLQGAHTRGENQDSIGVCYVGTQRPTPEQISSILALYSKLSTAFDIGYDDWYGHYEFTDHKICPGVSMDLIRALLKERSKVEEVRGLVGPS